VPRRDAPKFPLRCNEDASEPLLLRDTQESCDSKVFVAVFRILFFTFVMSAFISLKIKCGMFL
jgi:hypothetical protein